LDKQLSVPLTTKSLEDDGSFEGYASVFGVQDYDGDVVVKGAFSNTLRQARESGRMPKMLWQHNRMQIIGKWSEMSEDETGLFVKGTLILDVMQGREAYALLKADVIDGLSIGFNITEGKRGDAGVVIEEVDLMEVSLVTWGANPDALVTQVKARQSVRDFEAFLRESGFSRREATGIASKGFKAVEGQREAGDDEQSLDAVLASIKSLSQAMRG